MNIKGDREIPACAGIPEGVRLAWHPALQDVLAVTAGARLLLVAIDDLGPPTDGPVRCCNAVHPMQQLAGGVQACWAFRVHVSVQVTVRLSLGVVAVSPTMGELPCICSR